jgi:hypothetical protein
MITITKSMVALSALMAAGLVAAFDMAVPRAEDQSAAVQITQRFPVSSEMFVPVSMTHFVAQKFIEQQKQQADGRKGDKLPVSEGCSQQEWPYLSHNCLIAADGSPVRKVSRVITIERRVGDNVSELVRMPVADLAQR